MKFVRFGESGSEKPGLLNGDGEIFDISGKLGDLSGKSLSPETLASFADIDFSTLPMVPKSTRLGPCVSETGKFICIGLNYADHAAETGATIPSEPIVFMKATSAICGPNDDVYIPRHSEKTDWEVELAFVIGKSGKYIRQSEAINHIAGYFVANDVSERSFQTEREGQWTKGKSCDRFGPIGPWLVTRDEVKDPQNLSLWLKVNGELMQNGSTKTMIFGVAHLVCYLSQFMTLHAGDIVSTGTPPGVGMGKSPQTFLKDGDQVELGIEGLGEQKQNYMNDPD